MTEQIFLCHSRLMRLLKTALCLIFLLCGLTARATVSSLVADTKSGFIMESHEATIPQPPASLTKLMTLYLLFGALDNGLLTMDDALPISRHAAEQPASKIGLVAGESMTVREAMMALIIKSANDAAVVVAEALAQDEDRFAELMTETAHSLGLNSTTFKNASGLHAAGQVSTARDMAVLTMALIAHYPQYYSLFSTPSFRYKGQVFNSHNTVLQQYEGAEGLKTGYVSAVGYNIISTAKQGDTRLVSVVIGEDSALKRDLRAMRLLDKGFHQTEVQKRAQASGQLKGAFNPLNRRAFIAKPPVQMFLPVMRAGVALSRNKLASRPKVEQPVVVVHVPTTDVEQGDNWSIQVGAFEGQEKARQTAERAVSLLGLLGKEIATPRADNRFFRSRIRGFSQQEANTACRRLKDASWQCFTVAPNKS